MAGSAVSLARHGLKACESGISLQYPMVQCLSGRQVRAPLPQSLRKGMPMTDLPIEARLMTTDQVAGYLGCEEVDMGELLPQLYNLGFPHPLPVLDRWDVQAVDKWLDRKSGINPDPEPPLVADPIVFIPKKKRFRSPQPEVKHYRTPDPDLTVAQVIRAYITWFRGHRITYKNTSYYARAYLIPEFGHLKVSELKAEHLRAWLTRFTETPRRFRGSRANPIVYSTAPFDDEARRRRRNTANRLLGDLKAALNYAYREGWVPDDTEWRRVRPYPRAVVGPGTYLTVEQCRLLVAHCPPDFKRLVKGALYTGARLSELRRIKREDVDVATGCVAIYDGKQRSFRTLTLTDEATWFFDEAIAQCAPDSHVFVRADGNVWNETDPYPRLAFACQNAGIPRVTFHQLRHTFASLLAMEGTPMAVIARCLGHTTTRVCERTYAHLAPNYVSDTLRQKMPELGILEI